MRAEKEFLLRLGKFNLYTVYIQGGGEVPAVLSGSWNDPQAAKRDIDHYLATRRDYPSMGRIKSANISSKNKDQ
jgi:hypothetical protein